MRKLMRNTALTVLVAGAFIFSGCGQGGDSEGTGMDTTATDTTMMATPATATVTGVGAQAANVNGTLTFADEAGSLRVTGTINGLPAGEHPIGIVMGTDCTAPTAPADTTNKVVVTEGTPANVDVVLMGQSVATATNQLVVIGTTPAACGPIMGGAGMGMGTDTTGTMMGADTTTGAAAPATH